MDPWVGGGDPWPSARVDAGPTLGVEFLDKSDFLVGKCHRERRGIPPPCSHCFGPTPPLSTAGQAALAPAAAPAPASQPLPRPLDFGEVVMDGAHVLQGLSSRPELNVLLVDVIEMPGQRTSTQAWVGSRWCWTKGA